MPRCLRLVGASSTVRPRTVSVALRAWRPAFARRLLSFGRGVSRSMETVIAPSAGAARRDASADFAGPAAPDASTAATFRFFLPRTRISASGVRLLRLADLERVRLPVHHADHLALRVGAAQRRTVPVSLDPAAGLALFGRLRPALCRRRVEAGADDSQRQAARGHRQHRMQMQAPRLGAGLVGADHTEPLASRTGREVQVGSVLDAQNHRLGPHARQRAGAVRLQNGRGGPRHPCRAGR